jgi:cytidylate kinase
MNMAGNTKELVVTVDGPAGAGKSTVSKLLAQRLGYIYVDTGAMYRAVALLLKQKRESELLDQRTLEEICQGLNLQFVEIDGKSHLLANGQDVTEDIRKPGISSLASAVSAKAIVREKLAKIQRGMGKAGGVVFEGRDMGTVVFPDADIKFFLDADPRIRSQRRFLELETKGEKTSAGEVYQKIIARDRNDSSRQLAPLKPAKNAIIIDSTHLHIEDVVQLMFDHIQASNEAFKGRTAEP